MTVVLAIVMCFSLIACSDSSIYSETNPTVGYYDEPEEDSTNDTLTEEYSTDETTTVECTEIVDTKSEMLSLSELVPDYDFCKVGELKIPVGFQNITDKEILSQKYAITENTVFFYDENDDEIAIKYDKNIFSESDDITSVEVLSEEMMKTIKEISDDIVFVNTKSYENETGKAVSMFSFSYNEINVTYIVSVIDNYVLLVSINSSENDIEQIHTIACDIADSIEEF